MNLLGWSWGGMTAGYFASLHPEKVGRLVLFAPLYSGREADEPYESSGAYGLLPATGSGLGRCLATDARPGDGSRPLGATGSWRRWRPSSGRAIRRAARGIPPATRFPKGSFEDLHLARIGRPFWNASTISADTLVIRGERDRVAPGEHAEALMRDLTHARSKESVTVPGGTHFLQFEVGRNRLFDAVGAFLRSTAASPRAAP